MPDNLGRRPFNGPEGQIIRNILKQEIGERSYGLTYLVRGWPAGDFPEYLRGQHIMGIQRQKLEWIKTLPLNTHPKKQEILGNCMPYLIDDIRNLKPKQLIVMGNLTAEALFPNVNKSIMKLVEEYDIQYAGVPVRFAASPSVMIRNPASRNSWEKNFRIILRGERHERNIKAGTSHLITSVAEAKEYIKSLRESETDVAVDTETANLNKRYSNTLGTIQFSDNKHGATCLPWAHPESPFSHSDRVELVPLLHDLFSKPSTIRRWVAHNVKFENHQFLQNFGTYISSAPIFDTMVGAFLLDENRMERVAEFKHGVYSLKQLVLDYLNFDGYNSDVLAKREEGNLMDLPLAQVAEYGNMDSWITRRLMYSQIEEAKRQEYLAEFLNLMYSLYNPMLTVFTMIEWNGCPVNRQYLRVLNSKDSPLLKAIDDIIRELKLDPTVQLANKLIQQQQNDTQRNVRPLVGIPWVFDFAKKNHPQTLFFRAMDLEPTKIGDSGMPSVDDEFQTKYKDNKLVKKYSEWVECRKMMDSFAVAIYNYVDPAGTNDDCKTDSRVRPNYMLSKVVTGRAACNKPNLQSIPRGESLVKKAIKNIFQATDGQIMVQVDFKANEMRWVGILAQCDAMAKVFTTAKALLDEYRKNPTKEGLKIAEIYGDIHRANASKAYQIPIEEVTKELRQNAKGLSFGLLYDSSYKSISELYKIPEDEVALMFERWFSEHKAVYTWKMKMKEDARRLGYVQADQGRRRRFPIFDIYRENGVVQEQKIPREHRSLVADALRQASNSPVQGIASDAAYLGAYLFHEHTRKNGKKWDIQNAVHDSIVFQCPKEEIVDAIYAAEKCLTTDLMEYMTDAFSINFNVPLEVESELGYKWGELVKWDYTEAGALAVMRGEITK